jgi:putative membrane protein
MKTSNLVPKILLLIYTIIFIWSVIDPLDFDVWVVEAITSFITVGILVLLYIRGTRFSPLAYILMSVFPIMHIIGAHYTFAEVPSQWLSDLLNTDRNMYDRVAHFSVGFYAYGIIEYIRMKKLSNNLWLTYTYALFVIMAVAAAYELFEWQYAIMSDPSAGIAILGSQGDIWDAQKDILSDTFGAVLAIALYKLKCLLNK